VRQLAMNRVFFGGGLLSLGKGPGVCHVEVVGGACVSHSHDLFVCEK